MGAARRARRLRQPRGPLNAWHQHFNGSGTTAARFVSSTNMPPIINLYDEPEFVFSTPHDFLGRFNGEPDYLADRTSARACCSRPMLFVLD